MKLSVIIVNYNVKFFLEQALLSVQRASKGLAIETYVVDNNSTDGSCAMVKQKFPDVTLIENKDNPGFSVANNQAIRQSKGEYVLLLNPDTLVQEDTFRKVIDFMDAQPDAGGLGVKMVDGKGVFLPESKRGLPTPWVAFCKMSGLASMFPKSKTFGKYHLSYLSADQTHEIEVLAGAFMLMRRSTLDKVGLLDEAFFMYGEDIDLSYRITLGGMKNYYYPHTTIIHYKGESTKKGSLNYVLTFYKAMIIFAEKHFAEKNAKRYVALISLAVYFSAALSLLKRWVSNTILPVFDISLIFAGFYFLVPYWEIWQFNEPNYYHPIFMQLFVPAYILIWLGGLFFSGAYGKRIKLWQVFKSYLAATALILVIYALLPESWRFSRALILIGTLWGLAVSVANRFLLQFTSLHKFVLSEKETKRVIIVGTKTEAEAVRKILDFQSTPPIVMGNVCSSKDNNNSPLFLGTPEQLPEICRVNKPDELIFCMYDIDSSEIIQYIVQLSDTPVHFKIAAPQPESIVGSSSSEISGELYSLELNAVSSHFNKTRKRAFDLLFALGLLVWSPLAIWVFSNKKQYFTNIFAVLKAHKTWVGFSKYSPEKLQKTLKPGVLSQAASYKCEQNPEKAGFYDRQYAQNYKITTDFLVIIKLFRNLDRS